MRDCRKFYIDGEWVDPIKANDFPVENPATEEQIAVISLGTKADVDNAVTAASIAFEHFSQTSRQERLALLEELLAIYMVHYDDMAKAIHLEMGAPISFSHKAQADCGRGHIQSAIDTLHHYEFEHHLGNTLIVKEPIGVCGLITPWNWPINQIVCKVAPALATGCTIV
ncbi:MAG: aldehyde dehydrogenase family protein, partial [Porticoccus sp.]